MKKLNYILITVSVLLFLFGVFALMASYEYYTRHTLFDRALLGVSLIIGSSIMLAGALVSNAILEIKNLKEDATEFNESKVLFREN